MDSDEEEMFGACAFQMAAEKDNKKCIAGMMKDEGEASVKMALACMHEIAGCYNEDGSFNDGCFTEGMMKNKACLDAVMAMPKESESEESSSSEEVVEVTFSMQNFKKFKDCTKGKKGKDLEPVTKMLGCNMVSKEAMDKFLNDGKPYYENIMCSEVGDGSLMVSLHKEEGCEDTAFKKMMLTQGESNCVESGRGGKAGTSMKSDAVEQCSTKVLMIKFGISATK